MILSEVRTQFVKESGRYDLVTSNDSNNGADYYIQAGQRMLDRELPFPKDEGELTFSLSTGQIATNLSNVRAVRRVTLVDEVDNKMKILEKTDIASLRSMYYGSPSLASTDVAEPIFWALGVLREGVTTATTTTEAGNLKLVTFPPADQTYGLKVWTLLSSNALTSDASYSFWTLEFPEVLIQAALYQLEVSYRNYEGARALMAEITRAVQRITNDVVEQSLKDEEVLKDSHRFIEDTNTRWTRHNL